MADTPNADSLQIEIVASSTEAEKRIDALTAALERLKAAGNGLGSISNKIRGIGESAKGTAGSKTRQRNDALKRATEQAKRTSAAPEVGAIKTSMAEISRAVESAKNKYSELVNYINQNSGRITRDAASDALRAIHAEQDGLNKILDSFGDRIVPTELHEAVNALNDAEMKFKDIWANPAPVKIDMDAIRRQTEEIRNQLEQVGEKKEVIESNESLKEKQETIQKISDTVSNIPEKKGIDIRSPGGLKDLLGKDLSLQSLIPQGLSTAFGQIKEDIGNMTDEMIRFSSSHPVVAGALVAVKSAAQTAWKGFKGLAKISFSAIKKGFELVAAGAKKLGSALATIGKGIAKAAVSGIKSLVSAVGHRFTAPFEKAVSAITKFKNAVGRIIFLRAVRGAIRGITEGFKTGVEDLYQYSRIVNTEFAPAMDSLASSALYAKNSLGAMVAPIIQALAPAVEFLVQKFVELTAAIGKAFAALTGKKTFSQAVRVPKQYAEAATGAAKASNKAKKATDDYAEALQNFTIGIDELNVIEPPDIGDKLKDTIDDLDDLGNGAGGIDYGSMFEEVEISTETLDWTNQIREAIEKGDWYSVGEIVATKMNEVVEDWDSYGWGESFGTAINKGLNVALGFLENFSFAGLGLKIADWFNGLADGLEWETLGRVIAAKYNALYDFVYGFADSFDWYYIGKNISDAFNGFLDELDPEKAANAVTFFFTGLYELIYGTITGISWDTLGTKFAQFVNGVNFGGILYGALNAIIIGLSGLKKTIDFFLDNWDLSGMANQIYTAINEALTNKSVDWNGLGKTLGNLIGSAFQFANEILGGLDFSGIGETLGNIVNGFFEGMDWTAAGESVSAGITGIFNSILGFIGTLDWPLIASSVKDALIGGFKNAEQWLKSIDWKKTGENSYNEFKKVIEKLDFAGIAKSFFKLFGTALGSWITVLSSFISGVIDDIEGYFSEYIEKAKDKWGDNGAAIILGILEGIKNALVGIVTWVKENIFDPFINAFKNAFGIHSPSTVMEGYGENIMQGAINGVASKISEFVGKVQDAFNGVTDFLNNIFSGNWESALESLSTFASNIFNGITTFLSETFLKNWQSAWDSVSNVFKGIWNGIIGFIESAVNKIIDGVNWVLSALNSLSIDIPDFLGGGKIGFDFNTMNHIYIPRLASGGFPERGQMFIARENGPELVGNIGQKTAVVNNDQIINGISQGVENANEEQNALLREQNELLRALLNKDTTVRIGNKEIKRAYDTATRQSGASIMAGGVMA